MTDEEMVAYLARCQLEPAMPRPSIETLLHAFIPHPHVDHTHPDAIGSIVGATDGERLAEECFGDDAIWIPYIRPGFALSKLVADAVRANPTRRSSCSPSTGSSRGARPPPSPMQRHSTRSTGRLLSSRSTGRAPSRSAGRRACRSRQDRGVALLAEVMPALRGALSVDGPRVLQVDLSPAVLRIRRRPRFARALAGRRRVPRPSRAHQAAARVCRVRSGTR